MKLYHVLINLLKPLCYLLFRIKMVNKKNIPETGAYIICSNHISNLDPFLIAIGQKRAVHFMAKSELFKFKLLAWFFRKVGAFPVNRGRGDPNAVNEAFQTLKNGHVMGIFPEGTRTFNKEMLRFKPGAAMIAAKMQVPVIPAAIYCKGRIGLFKKITVRFGDPIPYQQLGVTEGSASELKAATQLLMDAVQVLKYE